MNLSQQDSDLLVQIKTLDSVTLTRGKDESGVPYLKHIFHLHIKLFGETCQGCADKIPGYIQRVKNFKNTPDMEKVSESNFKFNKGTMLPVRGTSKVITQHNLTDEKALELLAENPNRKVLFSKLPENVDQLIADFKAQQKDAKKSPAKAASKSAAPKASAPKAKPAPVVTEAERAVEDKPAEDVQNIPVEAEQVQPSDAVTENNTSTEPEAQA